MLFVKISHHVLLQRLFEGDYPKIDILLEQWADNASGLTNVLARVANGTSHQRAADERTFVISSGVSGSKGCMVTKMMAGYVATGMMTAVGEDASVMNNKFASMQSN